MSQKGLIWVVVAVAVIAVIALVLWNGDSGTDVTEAEPAAVVSTPQPKPVVEAESQQAREPEPAVPAMATTQTDDMRQRVAAMRSGSVAESPEQERVPANVTGDPAPTVLESEAIKDQGLDPEIFTQIISNENFDLLMELYEQEQLANAQAQSNTLKYDQLVQDQINNAGVPGLELARLRCGVLTCVGSIFAPDSDTFHNLIAQVPGTYVNLPLFISNPEGGQEVRFVISIDERVRGIYRRPRDG